MSKRSDEQYALTRIHSDYDLLKKYAAATGDRATAVAIAYTPVDNGRGGHVAKWRILSPFFKTNPKAHWTDYGCKAFDLRGRDRAEKLEEAKAWATGAYGVGEWRQTDRIPLPLGVVRSWFPAEIVDWLEAEIKHLREGTS